MSRQLDHIEFGEFQDALLDAFNFADFGQMLFRRLNKQLYNYAPVHATFETMVFEVVSAANRQGWVAELIAKSKEAVPNNPKLVAFTQKIGLASVSHQELERAIRETNKFLDASVWRTALGELEAQVCRIEIPTEQGKTFYGTGFLISPSIVITNYHVMEPVILGEQEQTTEEGYSAEATEVVCRFDYKKLNGNVVNPGTEFKLSPAWKIDASPNSPLDQLPPADNLDYALIRLNGAPGNDLVSAQPGSGGVKRGWIKMPATAYNFPKADPLFIMQHPDTEPLKLALETQSIIGLNGNKTRVTYRTNTEAGSSGSPCFTQNWELVALHHSGDPNFDPAHKPEYNEGIPFSAILTLWNNRHIQLD